MTDLRKAAQQALDVLIRASSYYDTYPEIAALEAALAEQDAEPVAWMTHSKDPLPLFHKTKAGAEAWGAEPQPLYAHPPRREWQGLTDDEINRVTDAQWARNNDKPIYAAYRAYARAIEDALKEKNNG